MTNTTTEASKPAAAQEAVAVVSGETFNDDGTSDIIKPSLPIGMKLYAAPVAAAPVDPNGLILDLRAAVSIGRPLLHSDVDEIERALASTPAAPVELDRAHSTEDNYQHFLAYSGLEGSDLLRYTYFHGADVGINRPRMQATPAAPGIDLDAMVAVAVRARGEHQANCRVTTLEGSLRKVCVAVIDASPKGGDAQIVGEVRIADGCIVSTSIRRPLPDGGYDIVPQASPKGSSTDAIRELVAAANNVIFFDWSDNDSDAAESIERLRDALDQVQATSAEVGA